MAFSESISGQRVEWLHRGEIWQRPYCLRVRSIIVIDGRRHCPQSG
jgi:hypothetical protein